MNLLKVIIWMSVIATLYIILWAYRNYQGRKNLDIESEEYD